MDNAENNTFSFGQIQYSDLKPVNQSLMDGKNINPTVQAELFRGLQTCPLVHSEMARASQVYPIVFAPEGVATPMAIFNLVKGDNPFAPGQAWEAHAYAPAAVRRYPYVAAQLDGSEDLVLSVDVSALQENTENPLSKTLFNEAGEPAEPFNDIGKFCVSFDTEGRATEKMVQTIENLGLFVTKKIDVIGEEGKVGETGAVRIVDDAKLRDLSDADLAMLVKDGIMSLIEAHKISLLCLGKLSGKLGA